MSVIKANRRWNVTETPSWAKSEWQSGDTGVANGEKGTRSNENPWAVFSSKGHGLVSALFDAPDIPPANGGVDGSWGTALTSIRRPQSDINPKSRARCPLADASSFGKNPSGIERIINDRRRRK
ncbi:hypothetical protein KM043_016451 [Ampulex compressa]|nr:hypothetical protein KM043_016451 [Ampulex compressa]